MATRCGDLERFEALRLFLNVDELSGLYAERRTVNDFPIDQDVAVRNHLSCLRCRTSEACAKDERVETHLEELHKVFTGEAVLTTSFLERDDELLLTDTV